MASIAGDLTARQAKPARAPGWGPGQAAGTSEAYWDFFSVLLGEVLDAEPLVLPLPDAEPDDGVEDVSLEPALLELELGEDEAPEPELGVDGVALEDDDELGELGVVALPDTEPEPEAPGERVVASLDEPDEDEPEVAPEVAPRFASPAGRSQPYRPPTAMAMGSRTNADFLSMDKLL